MINHQLVCAKAFKIPFYWQIYKYIMESQQLQWQKRQKQTQRPNQRGISAKILETSKYDEMYVTNYRKKMDNAFCLSVSHNQARPNVLLVHTLLIGNDSCLDTQVYSLGRYMSEQNMESLKIKLLIGIDPKPRWVA